jgi:hypothetical protein
MILEIKINEEQMIATSGNWIPEINVKSVK